MGYSSPTSSLLSTSYFLDLLLHNGFCILVSNMHFTLSVYWLICFAQQNIKFVIDESRKYVGSASLILKKKVGMAMDAELLIG